MKFCPNCGNKLQPGDRFCEKCGFQVAESQEETPTTATSKTQQVEKKKPAVSPTSAQSQPKKEKVVPVTPAVSKKSKKKLMPVKIS